MNDHLSSIASNALSVAYEDDDLLIVNKPADLPTAPLRDNIEADTLLLRIEKYLSQNPEAPKPEWDSHEKGLVHRLDTKTSGLVAYAKYPEELKRLRGIWTTSVIEKIYVAKVEAAPHFRLSDTTPGTSFEFLMAHSGRSKKKMMAFYEEEAPRFKAKIRGNPRHTITELLELTPKDDQTYFARVRIKTGVMHQIRCVLERIGIPIVGDPVYGLNKHLSADAPMYLHSEELVLPLKTGTSFKVKSAPKWT